MNAAQRREKILQQLHGASAPISASALAAKLGVSRQTISKWELGTAAPDTDNIVPCVHRTADEMRTELYTVVDQGGVVVDVAVENPLYGELRGNLNLASRYDVDTFITQAANTPECLLSRMTGGVHLHTLRCPDEETFQRIEAALREKGILY